MATTACRDPRTSSGSSALFRSFAKTRAVEAYGQVRMRKSRGWRRWRDEFYRRLAIIKLCLQRRFGSWKSSVGGAEVHHVFAKAGVFALAFLIMLVFAAMASLGVSLSAVSLRSTAPPPGEIVASTPAEIVASRFLSEDAASPVQPATFSTASVMPVEHWERFDQDALSGVATAEPPWPTAAGAT